MRSRTGLYCNKCSFNKLWNTLVSVRLVSVKWKWNLTAGLSFFYFFLSWGWACSSRVVEVSLIVSQSDSCKFIHPGVSAAVWKAAKQTCVHLSLFQFSIKENKSFLQHKELQIIPVFSAVPLYHPVCCLSKFWKKTQGWLLSIYLLIEGKRNELFCAPQMQGRIPHSTLADSTCQFLWCSSAVTAPVCSCKALSSLCVGWGFLGGLGSFSCFPQLPIPSAPFQFLQKDLERFS